MDYFSTLVESHESFNGKYKIEIHYDVWAESPCLKHDMGACFLFTDNSSEYINKESHVNQLFKNYSEYLTITDALIELAKNYVSKANIVKFLRNGLGEYKLRYSKENKRWELVYYSLEHEHVADYWYDLTIKDINDNPYDFFEFLSNKDLLELIKKFGKDIVVELFEFRYNGEYSKCVAYCTKDWYIKYDNHDTTNWKDKAICIINAEKEEIEFWMRGDVYGYVLKERINFVKTYENGRTEDGFEWNEVDACWGFYTDNIEEIITEYLPNE